LCRQLLRLKVVLVAIERPDGLLVERLLDAGLRVLALHPNQVAATRARFRVSGGKSDRFDAFVLCELARTDSHRFRVLEPDSDQTKALRALTRAREDLVHTKMVVSNQLRAELERFWPGPIGLFKDLDSQISLAFLERYPSPVDARSQGEQRLQAFLSRRLAVLQWRSCKATARQLLERVRRGCRSACCCKGCADAFGSRSELHRLANRGSQPRRSQLACRKPHTRACNLDPTGHLRLIAPKRDGHDRHAVRERLLGDAHTGVADDARRSVEHKRVRDEPLDPDVRRCSEAGRVDLDGRDDDVERLTVERLARDLGNLAVVLKQRRARDKHERSVHLAQPRRCRGMRLPQPWADKPDLRRPV
jgi:hypothetical protein